jgi:hypothetical protein
MYPLQADAIPSVFGRAIGIHRENDHYNQISVLHGVPHLDGGEVDVVYVATDQGNIIKMVNTNPEGVRGSGASSNEDRLKKISVFHITNQPIRHLTIANGSYLIAMADTVLYKIPLHMCEAYTSCSECIGVRDPHCAMHEHKCVHFQRFCIFIYTYIDKQL